MEIKSCPSIIFSCDTLETAVNGNLRAEGVFGQVAVFVHSRQRGLVSMGRNQHHFVLPHGPIQVQSLLISCSNYSMNHSNAFRFKNRNIFLGGRNKQKNRVRCQNPNSIYLGPNFLFS